MDAQLMGLLSGAAGGLEASGPSRTPVSMGQILSRGLLSGMQGYQGQEDRNQRAGLLAAQLGQLKLQEEVQRENMKYQQQQREQALLLQKARAGIFGDPGVSPQQALQGGGGPTNDNAAMIRQPNPMAINPQGVQQYLMAGGDPKVIEAFQNLGPQGRVNKIDLEKFEAPSVAKYLQSGNLSDLVPRTRKEAVTAAGPDGSPVTQFIDMYNPPSNSLPQPIKREAVNSGGRTDFVNPYAQTGSIARTATPDALMADARAGQTYDAERGVVVNTRNGTASPVMAGGAPIGPKPEKLGESAVKQITGVGNLKNAISEYREALKKFNTTDAMTPDGRAKMGTMYNNMMLQAKEAYNLGVLNGPDYTILQSVVRDPNSLMGMITSKDALDKQASELDRIMTSVAATTASGSKVQKPYAGPERRAPQPNAIVDGYRFKGGNPASPSSWEKI